MPGAQETPFTPDQIASMVALSGSQIASADSFLLLDQSDQSMSQAGTIKTASIADLQVGLTNVAGQQKGLEESVRGTTGSLASTFDRALYVDGTRVMTTGRIELARVALQAGMPISKLRCWPGLVGSASGITHFWMGIFDKSLNRMALTVDDATATTTAATLKEVAMASVYTVPKSDIYYIGICQVATTMGNMSAMNESNSGLRLAAPCPSIAGDSSLTTPASCPAQLTLAGATATIIYAEAA